MRIKGLCSKSCCLTPCPHRTRQVRPAQCGKHFKCLWVLMRFVVSRRVCRARCRQSVKLSDETVLRFSSLLELGVDVLASAELFLLLVLTIPQWNVSSGWWFPLQPSTWKEKVILKKWKLDVFICSICAVVEIFIVKEAEDQLMFTLQIPIRSTLGNCHVQCKEFMPTFAYWNVFLILSAKAKYDNTL